ncbi:hypothetical protein AB0N09_40485 [Streptomyces erythrochromogenes]|uniref:hypothetical protein n=1 Tax=Streptomyces erythrochromogenes TaxID=285574 RepID=UPI003419B75D
MYRNESNCAYLMNHAKMNQMVKDCLVKAGIGGAVTLVVGRYLDGATAEQLASRVVSAGAVGCLGSLA